MDFALPPERPKYLSIQWSIPFCQCLCFCHAFKAILIFSTLIQLEVGGGGGLVAKSLLVRSGYTSIITKSPEMTTFQGFPFGGEGGIRTLDTLMGYTRFPIVRARPNYATSPRF